MRSVGIQALSVHLPDTVRSNGWWSTNSTDREGVPPLQSSGRKPRNLFDAAMQPYIDDPFFGSVERRIADAGEGSVSLGIKAARSVLETTGIAASEVDGLISVSMFSDRVGAGDAGYLAQALGTGGGAFSLEATCSGSMSALLTASALVQSGLKERVLVVVVSMLSRAIDADDVTARLCGDAAAAFLVGPVEEGYGLLGSKTLQTGETCGTWLLDTVEEPEGTTAGGRRIRLRVDPTITHVLRATAKPYLVGTVEGALEAAQLKIDDIDVVVPNTPTAWHARFSADTLGLDPDRVVNTFPSVANIGPALMPVNTHLAAVEGRIKPGDRVLLYTFGGQAEAGAAVVRWPSVRLGPAHAGARTTLNSDGGNHA